MTSGKVVRIRSAFLAVACVLLVWRDASPAPILFDNRAIWVSEVGHTYTDTFEGTVIPGHPDGNGREQQYYAGMERDRFFFTVDYDRGNELIAATPAVPTTWPLDSTALVWQGPDAFGPPSLHIQFSRPTTAVGFDIGPGNHGPNQIYASLFGEGMTYDLGFDTGTDGFRFWGVLLDLPINSMTLSVTGAPPGELGYAAWVDDFSVAAPVPEPATILLVGGGVAGILRRSFKRRRVPADIASTDPTP